MCVRVCVCDVYGFFGSSDHLPPPHRSLRFRGLQDLEHPGGASGHERSAQPPQARGAAVSEQRLGAQRWRPWGAKRRFFVGCLLWIDMDRYGLIWIDMD